MPKGDYFSIVKRLPVVIVAGGRCPARAHPGDSGYDLFARLDDMVVMKPGQRALIPAGFRMALPPNFEAQIRSRSGLALNKGVFVLNSPGTIDSGYRGEVGVILCNFGTDDYIFRDGERVAQMVINHVPEFSIEEVLELDPSDRDDDGFGSTGT